MCFLSSCMLRACVPMENKAKQRYWFICDQRWLGSKLYECKKMNIRVMRVFEFLFCTIIVWMWEKLGYFTHQLLSHKEASESVLQKCWRNCESFSNKGRTDCHLGCVCVCSPVEKLQNVQPKRRDVWEGKHSVSRLSAVVQGMWCRIYMQCTHTHHAL